MHSNRGGWGWALAAPVVAVLVAAVVLVGPGLFTTSSPAPGSPTRAQLERLLAVVRVLPQRPHPGGYERGCAAGQGCVFGTAWADGSGGCDSRNAVLGKQLSAVRFRTSTEKCVVSAGTLHDPYTGRDIAFDRSRARTVQIDHIYPLAAAWDMGASDWPLPQRIRFANDIQFNLLAVDGRTNQDKGDRTPADWLPPALAYRCYYAGRYLTTAVRYTLPITAQDRDALSRLAEGCP
ncbi:HNH endonuclease family protein [Nocardia jiangxiensis]|uniref:HNH endonuclease family protein n=1 Tax=Nocardia jiangxiensis TaxID=282685 RepID=A0ABW6RZ88_9NOCA